MACLILPPYSHDLQVMCVWKLEVWVFPDVLTSFCQAVSCDSQLVERIFDRLFDGDVCDPSSYQERDHIAQEVCKAKSVAH